MNLLISFGQSNPGVRDLQQVLNHVWRGAGAALATDGIFGAKTLSRVREFQRQQGFQADGIVGPVTARGLVGCVFNRIRSG